MTIEKSRRINLRLTPTDRLSISRIIALIPSTVSEVVRFAIHTAFLLLQCAREANLRLVLRNDDLHLQEDLDLTLLLPDEPNGKRQRPALSRESEPTSGDVLQLRLTTRALEQLDSLVQTGFALNRTAAIRRAVDLLHRVASKTRGGSKFGTLSDLGVFTPLPVLDLVYSENRNVEQATSVPTFGAFPSSIPDADQEPPRSPFLNSTAVSVEALDGQGRYELLRELSLNPLAQRYLVRDQKLGRLCSAKLARTPPDIDYADRVHLFDEELRVTLSIDGDHVCNVIDAGIARRSDADLPFIVSDFADVTTLEEELHQGVASRSLLEVVQIIDRVADALSALHDRNLIHGDLHPGNIVITRERGVKLVDFGLCIDSTKRPDLVRKVAQYSAGLHGTRFVAPELASGDSGIDTRSDIYSLGAVFRCMVDAWEGPVQPPHGDDSLSAWSTVEKAIDTALRPFPEERFQTIEEFRNVLRKSEIESFLSSVRSDLKTAGAAPSTPIGMLSEGAWPEIVEESRLRAVLLEWLTSTRCEQGAYPTNSRYPWQVARRWTAKDFQYICSFAGSYPESLRAGALRTLDAALMHGPLYLSGRPKRSPDVNVDLYIRSAKLPPGVLAHAFMDTAEPPSTFVVLVRDDISVDRQYDIAWEEVFAHVVRRPARPSPLGVARPIVRHLPNAMTTHHQGDSDE